MEDEHATEVEEAVNGLIWDKPFYHLNGEPWIPIVFDHLDAKAAPQSGYNSIVIRLQGHMKADLNWKEERRMAKEWIEKGYFILWEIDLGLFSRLPFPLSNQTQFLSLVLSLEYFRDTVWKEFSAHSLGLILYRGFGDFSLDFAWNEEQVSNLRGWLEDQFGTVEHLQQEIEEALSSFQAVEPSLLLRSCRGRQLLSLFCRDVAVEYLALLRARLADTIPCYLLLDVAPIAHLVWQAQLLHPERFEAFNLAVKGQVLPFTAMGWQEPSLYGFIGDNYTPVSAVFHEETVGVCLPPMDMCRLEQYQGLDEALERLIERAIPFRLIPEEHLITAWEGLDYLIYSPSGLSFQGKRKLQGFCAAGGTAVTVNKTLGLAQELSLQVFLETLRF